MESLIRKSLTFNDSVTPKVENPMLTLFKDSNKRNSASKAYE